MPTLLPLAVTAIFWHVPPSEGTVTERWVLRVFGILIGCLSPLCIWFVSMDMLPKDYRQAVFCRETFAALRNNNMKREEAALVIGAAIKNNTINEYKFVPSLIRASIPGTEPVLIDLMRARNDRLIASDLLNSGNKELRDAATTWAKEKGYSITTMRTGQGSAQWR